MIKALLNGLLSMITSILNIFLIPINALIDNVFPDMASAINTFNTFVNTYIGSSLSFFFSLFPPIFRNILFIWVSFIIAYYTIHFTYTTIIKIWAIIQKIKFW